MQLFKQMNLVLLLLKLLVRVKLVIMLKHLFVLKAEQLFQELIILVLILT